MSLFKKSEKSTTPTKSRSTSKNSKPAGKCTKSTQPMTTTKQNKPKYLSMNKGLPTEFDVRVYERLPKGWRQLSGGGTAPHGYKWVIENKPITKSPKMALLKTSTPPPDWNEPKPHTRKKNTNYKPAWEQTKTAKTTTKKSTKSGGGKK